MGRIGLLFVLVVACGGSAKPTASSTRTADSSAGDVANPIPTTGGPDCAVVADRAATVAHADTPDRQAEARDLIRTHCVDDKWADDARSCFGTVETDDEVHGCMKLLTAAQRDALHAAAPAGMPPKAPMSTGAAPGGKETDSTAKDTKPKTKGGTRGAVQKSSSDPCEGGEGK